MIEILPESEGNFIALKATGMLTVQDYEKFIIPLLDKSIKEFEKIRALLYLDDDFEGWNLGAMLDDAKFGISHRHQFEKIAVVGGPVWIGWSVRLGGKLIDGDIKSFPAKHLERAMEWIRA